MDGPIRYNAYLQPGRNSFGSGDYLFLRRSFVVAGRRLRQELLQLLDDLTTGAIGLQGFSFRANKAVRDAYWIAYSIGALSINPFHTLTDRDMYVIDRELREERRFLKTFSHDISRGVISMDPSARSFLYLRGLRGMFELGRLEAAPWGPFLWVLGETEHCASCIDAAMGGPYQKDRYSGLGLPVLPGVPGSGDLCQGLTRCGCRITLANGLHHPNEELQGELRELLAEIVDGNQGES